MGSTALPGQSVFLHGGDYNPDQWLDRPDILREDLRLMKLAGVNVVSLGIFAWANLEPREGEFSFEWMDHVIEALHGNGQQVILATPSGAKPNWLALKYPQVRRCDAQGRREPQQLRHNHCMTSPVYREKVRIINTHLARRYGKSPALALWHLSNEYGGECYCDLCKQAFRQWLRERYKTVEAMNQAWWAHFWSHTFGDFDEVDAIDPHVNGLALDWKRFTTDQTVDFMRAEIAPLREFSPQVPVTTNMMGTFEGLDYWRFAPALDVISWDSYPLWHSNRSDYEVASDTAFKHDLNRSLKRRPWLLMESTPSNVNWASISRPKKPGVHRLACLQAVAHGADAICYFQWRKGRGSAEKFHGAVVDHVGHEHTRVFGEVAAVGRELAAVKDILGSEVRAKAAVIFDWENRWAINSSAGCRHSEKNYEATVQRHYHELFRRGVAADVIESTSDLADYQLVIAPMLYMLKPGVAGNLRRFVHDGGTLISTYMTGIANETDLVFTGGWPADGLMELFGVWAQEQDLLWDHQSQSLLAVPDNGLGLTGSYAARHYAEVLYPRGARVLATFEHEFYAGFPALSVNSFGRGKAYYTASRNDDRFHSDFIGGVLSDIKLQGSHGSALPLPDGISVQVRRRGEREFIFVMNFTESRQDVSVANRPLRLEPWGCQILRVP
ncbi:MAG: beta-galactosidase [Phycisphaerae bacterium]|nr:beta-galactosidase [Phycisphaerae bacterium]